MLFTTGTFARAIERCPETVRNLERRGVVRPTRDATGRRLFTAEDLRRVREFESRKARQRELASK
jgi:DNA-binding transcriptional MerR regulator